MIQLKVTPDMRKLHREYYKSKIVPRLEASKKLLGIDKAGKIDVEVNQNFKDDHENLVKYCIENWKVLAVGTPDKLKEFYEEGENKKVFERLKKTLKAGDKAKYKYGDLKNEATYTKILQHIFGYGNFTESQSLYELAIANEKNKLIKAGKPVTTKADGKMRKNAYEALQKDLTKLPSLSGRIPKTEVLEEMVEKAFLESITLKNYTNYKVFAKEWNAYTLVFMSGLRVCPYCNRQYITPVFSQDGKARADLDHFLPKKLHPYFSMSLYNLIPCCKSCNSSLKGSREFTFTDIHPYRESIDDYMCFKADLSSTKAPYPIALEARNKKDQKKVDNYNSAFKTETLYNYHQDIVKDLLLKRNIYTEEYIEELNKNYGEYFSSREEIEQLIIGYVGDRKFINNEPLSKLKIDLVEQMGFKKDKCNKEVDEAIKALKKTFI